MARGKCNVHPPSQIFDILKYRREENGRPGRSERLRISLEDGKPTHHPHPIPTENTAKA